MLTSLGFVILGGAALAAVCRKIQLPTIIGLMLAGMLLGPQGGNWLDSTMLTISPDLRQLALIVILVKAGLAINLRDIWSLGRPLLMMSTVPMLIELTILTYLGLYVFGSMAGSFTFGDCRLCRVAGRCGFSHDSSH